MDLNIAPDSPGGCSGRDPVLAPGSPAAKKRKPRRLREEGAVGVVIMISDTRGFWHADMIRSAAARHPWAKSATGVFGLVLTRWRLASTDAGRNEIRGTPLLGKGSLALTYASWHHGPTCTPQDLGTFRSGATAI